MEATSTNNRLLLSLPNETRRSLLSVGKICHFEPKRLMPAAQFVHFIETGSVSVLTPDSSLELAVLSSDGIVGYENAFGIQQPCYPVQSHREWTSLAVPTEFIRRGLAADPALQQLGQMYCYALLARFAEGAGAAAKVTIRARLARRLLIAADHLGEALRYTHDEFARLLGVRRPGVTIALHELEGEHLIKAYRGRILIMNRPGLEVVAGETYGRADRIFDGLFPVATVSTWDATARKVA